MALSLVETSEEDSLLATASFIGTLIDEEAKVWMEWRCVYVCHAAVIGDVGICSCVLLME